MNRISNIVQECLDDIGESNHRYQSFLRWAYRGLQEFFLDGAQKVRVVEYTLSATKTTPLPPGFVDWTKIAVQKNGALQVLARQEGSVLHYNMSPGGKEQVQLAELADAGAYFAIDLDSQLVCFTSQVTTGKVYIEYISDGVGDCCEDTMVHPYLREYLEFYIHDARVRNNDEASQALKYEKSLDLHYAKVRARARVSGMTLQDMLAADKANKKS